MASITAVMAFFISQYLIFLTKNSTGSGWEAHENKLFYGGYMFLVVSSKDFFLRDRRFDNLCEGRHTIVEFLSIFIRRRS